MFALALFGVVFEFWEVFFSAACSPLCLSLLTTSLAPRSSTWPVPRCARPHLISSSLSSSSLCLFHCLLANRPQVHRWQSPPQAARRQGRPQERTSDRRCEEASPVSTISSYPTLWPADPRRHRRCRWAGELVVVAQRADAFVLILPPAVTSPERSLFVRSVGTRSRLSFSSASSRKSRPFASSLSPLVVVVARSTQLTRPCSPS